MQPATSFGTLLLYLGLTVSACDDGTEVPAPTPTTPTAYTWTEVSTDIRSTCAFSSACHSRGTIQPFSYDLGLVAGADMDNYNAVLAAMLVNTSAPGTSPLIVVGKGGMYMGKTHGPNLSGTLAAEWVNWVAAGAIFP